MNLADYLDAGIMPAMRPATFAPLAPPRVTYAGSATTFAPARTAAIPTPPASVIRAGLSPLFPSLSPVTSSPIAPPPNAIPPSAIPPSPTDTFTPGAAAPVQTATPSPDGTAPADGSAASGDSGGSSSGFGWLLIAVGGYLLYKGLK